METVNVPKDELEFILNLLFKLGLITEDQRSNELSERQDYLKRIGATYEGFYMKH